MLSAELLSKDLQLARTCGRKNPKRVGGKAEFKFTNPRGSKIHWVVAVQENRNDIASLSSAESSSLRDLTSNPFNKKLTPLSVLPSSNNLADDEIYHVLHQPEASPNGSRSSWDGN
ncbi:hypothetical protein K0M31_000115 [Melipona bicolor]|uniref:Uncharacterized protein n=1 Tax=Melipona bicolor TaxID=60889 RepID=A0AA40KWC3_9HYME|nr:hypothetical protein K0M31_000115 [Melipona bicolor]